MLSTTYEKYINHKVAQGRRRQAYYHLPATWVPIFGFVHPFQARVPLRLTCWRRLLNGLSWGRTFCICDRTALLFGRDEVPSQSKNPSKRH